MSNSIKATSNWTPQWIPASTYARSLPSLAPIQPTPKIGPAQETAPTAAPVAPQAALRSWLNGYVSSQRQDQLFDRVVADPSAEATLFRRGLMVSGVVTLSGNYE